MQNSHLEGIFCKLIENDPPKKKKILIAEDEAQALDFLDKKLSAAGYDVFRAADGRQVVSRTKEIAPDLILLDIMLPEIDGMEIKKILNKEPDTASIPLIFLSARGMIEDKVRGLGLGADDYITKPFAPAELLARVESTLKRRKFYEELALTDGLTGLYNAHFFKKQFKVFFEMAKRLGQVFSLVIIDVNDFKPINDTCGHKAGDQVLKTIAARIKDSLRTADIVTRYGGDEFALILPGCDKENAKKIMSKIKERVKEEEFVFGVKENKMRCSISVGIAVYTEAFENESQMFEAADVEMYKDKKLSKRDLRAGME